MPAPPTPAPPTPAPPSLAALRAAAAPIECTLTNPQLNDEGLVFVTGLSRRGPPDAALRAAIGAVAATARVAWSVTGFDGPYCEALNVLRPMRLRDLRESAALALTLKGDVTRLRQDDRMVLRVVMPDFAAHLQVDYLSSDGTIGHLLADDGAFRHVWTPDGMKRIGPTRRYAPGEVVLIGEPDAASGCEGWAVDEPFGVDMVVAIAAAAPLRRTPPPVSESAPVYFRDLRAALEAAEAEKVALSGQALLVETVPR